jgi:hypothetical protein
MEGIDRVVLNQVDLNKKEILKIQMRHETLSTG